MALEALQRNGHNLQFIQETAGTYKIPVIYPTDAPKCDDWISFNCVNTATNRERKGVHFFIDDYLFLRTWNDPPRYGQLLSEFRVVMTPDFSLFTDYPKAVQVYNHYRKHLLGAYWQSLGVTVVPTICWSDRDSFEWCFDGEPVGGTVAVSSVGTQKNPDARALFLDGYREMMDRLKPTKVLFFGDVPAECEGNIENYAAYHHRIVRNKTVDLSAGKR